MGPGRLADGVDLVWDVQRYEHDQIVARAHRIDKDDQQHEPCRTPLLYTYMDPDGAGAHQP